jgi:hypothetical protein
MQRSERFSRRLISMTSSHRSALGNRDDFWGRARVLVCRNPCVI